MVTELYIERLVAGGNGLAMLDGMKVFVPHTAPQERIRARITLRKRDYATAVVEEIIEPSPLRVNPPCPYYADLCGGCQLQHIGYTGQLIVKKLIVNDALQHLGRVFLPVSNMSESEAWHYRNKTQYPVACRDREARIGFFRRGTHQVTDITTCLLHPPEFDNLRRVTAEAIRRWELAYDERHHEGNVRHLILRQGDDGILALLVTREGRVDGRLVDAITGQRCVTGIVQSINPLRTNRILGNEFKLLHGRNWLPITVLKQRFRVSAGSFFQVNRARAEEVCRKVLRFAAPVGTETVLDLYSGVGMLSVTIARFCRQVIGVEIDPQSVDDARFNAELAGVRNIEFRCAAVEQIVDELPAADIVILDPPRKGVAPSALMAIVRLRPNRIVYVSCNPATLARDLALLEAHNYSTTDVHPVDMFPQTAHVEVVARLERNTY